MNVPREIEQEIQDLVDGHLPEERQGDLIERISRDPELSALLVSYTGMDIAISKALRFPSFQAPKAKPLRQVVQAFAVTAAVVALLVFFLWDMVIVEEQHRIVLRGAPGAHYTLLRSAGSERKDKSPDLFEGDGVRLNQGALELVFGSGVRAVLEGPAELLFEEKDRVRLRRGRARFEVPPAMAGFRVVSEDAVVTDLGTKFALEATEGEGDEVHVIQGKVMVAPRDSPDRGQIVLAGQARSITRKGGVTVIAYKGSSFPGELPSGLRYLHLPMEVKADGSLIVDGDINGKVDTMARFVPGEGDRVSIGPVEGRFGGALGFNGKGDHIVTDWMGVGGDAPRTVAFWAKVAPGYSGYDLACVAWGYRPPGIETSNQKWNVQLALDRNERSKCILNATFGGLWMEGETLLNDNKWHHVAVVYAGRNLHNGMPDLKLYVDGKPESGSWKWNDPIDRVKEEVRVRTLCKKERGAHPLTVAKTVRSGSVQTYFKGEIDELYVVAGALWAVDIHNLWQNNRFDSGPPIMDVPTR